MPSFQQYLISAYTNDDPNESDGDDNKAMEGNQCENFQSEVCYICKNEDVAPVQSK